MVDNNNFENISISIKRRKKWTFGDGRKFRVIKYSSCKDDYEKICLFEKWLYDPNKFTKYISEEKYNFIKNLAK